MDITSENLIDLIPHYLPNADKQTLIQEIKKFPDLGDYTIKETFLHILQGDVWNGLTVMDFYSGEKREVKGIILSNTCDISPENDRKLPVKITFAPVFKVSSLLKLLESKGVNKEKIEGFISSLKGQTITNYFYLPANEKITEDYVVNFSDLYSIPSDSFLNSEKKENILSLSQSAFYFFIFKLSIHFCRLNESVNRYSYV